MARDERAIKRRIAFYGRVSTEHEAQLSALENQMQWYDDQLERHENWTLVNKYIDRGITGTLAKKRPAFLQMIKDAERGEFDLIVTREVCRFARNTVDALDYTRKLRKYGVEVFFVEDNIWTFGSDGELRLTIMAAMAQEESRKVAERVRAGQKISRDNGVLYGNGNILGYELKRNIDADGKWNPAENTYVINAEQAETVKMIYDMYCDGKGYTKICKELERLGRKDALGKVSWCASKIGRILHNMTYAGYKGYLKSYTTDYLEHSRVKNLDKDSYMYVKGDWEPIISEEQWNQVQELCKTKAQQVGIDNKVIGKKPASDIWLRKLRCSCGSKYRRNKWRTNMKNNEVVYGYQCYNQVNNGSLQFRVKNGLDTEGYCSIRMVGEWKLHFMSKMILESLWTDRQQAVEDAIEMIKECYTDETAMADRAYISQLESQIEKCEKRLRSLLEMRMDGEISKTEYAQIRETVEAEINECKTNLLNKKAENVNVESLDKKLEEMKVTMEQYIDFSGDKIPEEILDKLLIQVVPLGSDRFRWYLNLRSKKNSTIVCGVSGRKNKPVLIGGVAKHPPYFQPSTGRDQK